MIKKLRNIKVCSVCGSSYEEIIKNERIGCPECYYTFSDEFKLLLKTYKTKKPYTGSLPKRLKGYKSTLVNRVEMQLRLDEAIEREEYEKAALYRDYLKVLNTKIVTLGEDVVADSGSGEDISNE